MTRRRARRRHPPTPGAPAVTVSVVIPVKDDAVALRRCLRALQLQTRQPDEVIVVDNASTDASAAVAHDAGAVVTFCGAPGIPAAAAHGYDRAGGDLVLRLDADCVPAASWAAEVVAAFERRRDVSAFTGGARFIDGPRALRRPLAAAYLTAYAVAAAPALGHLPLFGSNLAFRRSAWTDVRHRAHRHDPELHDDLDLSFHLGERHRIRFARHTAMGMSMRPFTDARGFVRRVARGARTVTAHWPQDFPPLRWTRLLLRRVLARLAVPTPARVRS
ncbi:glycosyltransferase family 2 protein [Microbacterium sp. W1N]|uniref:glycosyltransferase family 2 protein n=1 Tax=Microbacterium festucae TaxID=2977531 RepID=UPI0021BE01FF|nr:glycosyltransferase family 2 protein [Microbacterium festucae]MCT9820509.1 glycosyltransferase family 2 protein [Microbacterium festucae]